MTAVGLLAHPSAEDSTEAMAHDVVALGMALMGGGHRILLHASSGLALPLMLAAAQYRGPVVLEGAERRPSPIVMLPMRRPIDSAEADDALFAPVPVDSTASGAFRKGEATETSLFDQLVALGIVDVASMELPQDRVPAMLLEMETRAVVSMGWHDDLTPIIGAAEAAYRERQMPMLVAGPRRGSLNAEIWQDLAGFVEIEIPEMPLPEARDNEDEERSAVYRAAWRDGRARAEFVMLAGHLRDRLAGD